MPKRTPPPSLRSVDQPSTQSVAFDVPANHEEMSVVLNRKALVPLLVNVPQSDGLVVGMIAYRMRASDPTHEPTRLAINQPAKQQMIVVRHQLKCKEFHLIDLQALIEDSFQRFEVRVSVKDGCSQVATIQSVTPLISQRKNRVEAMIRKC